MKYILIFGASIVHGVGGEQGGWADKIKRSFHKQMYGPDGERKYTVYELGVPGTSLEDIQSRFESELKARVKDGSPNDIYIVFSAGTNDSTAVDEPDRYKRTPEDFAADVHSFIHLAKDYSAHLLGVGVTPVDEAKTSPRNTVYYSNQRLKMFEDALQGACAAEGAAFVPLIGIAPGDWKQRFSYSDGLHPNDAGHEWIRNQVEPVLRQLIQQDSDD
jgi:lysophospholipase L1-like esterase